MAKIDRVQEVSTELLVPYANNAKKHSKEQVDKIAESIKSFGFLSPCLIDYDYNIIAGHGRVMAALQIGLPTVPCVFIDGLSEAERRAYILADNRLTELGDWDFDLVQEELEALNDMDFNIELTGFEMETEDIKNPEIFEDEYEEENVETRVKEGELWQLGPHRLVCGDSTNKKMVDLLFNGEQPFCVVTDPPYCSGGFQEAGKKSGSIGTRDNIMIANDTLSTRGYTALIKNVVKNAGQVGIIYMFTDWRMWVNLFDVIEASGYGVRNMIVWNKGTPGMGVGWRSQHELILMGSRSAQKFNPHKAQGNVITCQRTGNINHPTEKPVELIGKIIDITDFADIIYDPFGGSGTTLIACEQLGRKCFMAELDPHYCDVIISRWENLTGKKAVLLNG